MVAIGRSRTCSTALVAAALSTALVAPGCASPSGRAHRAPSATGSTPYVTGLGSTLAVWNAHHSAAGATVLTDPRGRVDGYVLFVPPEPLADAIARVRADLPPDATAGAPEPAEGVEGTKCEIVEFRSETLGRLLGNDGDGNGDSDKVMAVFETAAATTMDTASIAQITVVSGHAQLPRRC